MGSAGTIIQWIVQLFPLLQGLIEDIINAFKKNPTPAPTPPAAFAAVSTGTILGYLMHLLPFLEPLVQDGIALAQAEPAGTSLPAELQDKAKLAAKLFSDLADALATLPGSPKLDSFAQASRDLSGALAALA